MGRPRANSSPASAASRTAPAQTERSRSLPSPAGVSWCKGGHETWLLHLPQERAPAQAGFIFTASSAVKSKERPFERSPAPLLVAWPAEAMPRRKHCPFPPPHAPSQRAKTNTTTNKRLTFSVRFIPSPSEKAIWCFVYRESCHGELCLQVFPHNRLH